MTDDPAYFLYHSIGLYPDKAEEMAVALTTFSQTWGATDDGQWPSVLGARAEFIDLWSVLIDAPEGSLTSASTETRSTDATSRTNITSRRTSSRQSRLYPKIASSTCPQC